MRLPTTQEEYDLQIWKGVRITGWIAFFWWAFAITIAAIRAAGAP
jgi:hypothetical protein